MYTENMDMMKKHLECLQNITHFIYGSMVPHTQTQQAKK